MRIRTAMPFLAVLGALLSGCSGDSGDRPTTLPSLTATPTATALVATVPAEAREGTRAGAAAFVKYWFALLDESYEKGVTFPSELNDPNCNACKNFAGVADDLARDGNRFEGPSFTELTAESPPFEGDYAYVSMSCLLPARVELRGDGSVVKRYPDEGRLRMTAAVHRVGSTWVMRELRTEK